jgi:D-aminopeptidase
MKKGTKNKITDVEGVLVGHSTLVEGDVQTGVTAILPKKHNWFHEKTRAAVHVFNGFGKSIGLVQVDELFTLETPILLTNTLSAAHVADCLIKYMMRLNEDIGGSVGTVNPIVMECNDGYLNNIRKQVVTEHHVFLAMNDASDTFEEGAVGAGRGMSCFQLKGGIGSASRVIEIDEECFTVGGLVLSNMGLLSDLRIEGAAVGELLQEALTLKQEADKGSIIMIIATDAPLESHQLKRIVKRAGAGLARTGSFIGHGSGDIALGFTTADPVDYKANGVVYKKSYVHDQYMDHFFKATVEVIEESIINSLLEADEVTGHLGHNRKALKHLIKNL